MVGKAAFYMSKKMLAELLVETLAFAGVERIYGVAGDSLNGITDSIRKRDDIRWIPVRHEETAAFAAGAEAHLTGHLAVCAGSCGPGNLHLINGLYDAHRSRVPVLAIAAHIPSREIGSGYFQETHPEQLFRECSHYCELVSHPEQMPRMLEIALQTAVSRRGVSVLVLPGDIALQPVTVSQPRLRFTASALSVRPCDDDIDRLAQVLNGARKVTILGGAGCAGAHDQLIEVAGKLQAPIVYAMRGKEFAEYDNPFDVGMTGLLGFASGYYAMMHCETLLMLGTDFPYQQFYPEKATIVLDAPVKLVVFRNDALSFVELEMKAAGFLNFATELHNPDFAKMAEAAGLLGLTAETPEQVRPMLVKALTHDGPALVEVLVNRQELAMPPSIELDQMIGFSLYLIKAVLNGRGDEIIDLAKTNLFR
jgi:thiamine pyrophosphate-dependent acetolactate synthase large subunit-like protein